jgi:hypothetical protein
MAGKSICNARQHRLMDGLVGLNSGKTLTFTKAMSIKSERKENMIYFRNPGLGQSGPQSFGLGRWENEW